MFCKGCGKQIPEDSSFCGFCGVALTAQQIPSTRAASGIARETKSSGVGIVLSFFWTGLGQLYAGAIPRGLVMMLSTPVIWAIGWFGGFAAFLGSLGVLVAPTAQDSASAGGIGFFGFLMAMAPLAWWIWGMVDAKRLCEAFNRGAPV